MTSKAYKKIDLEAIQSLLQPEEQLTESESTKSVKKRKEYIEFQKGNIVEFQQAESILPISFKTECINLDLNSAPLANDYVMSADQVKLSGISGKIKSLNKKRIHILLEVDCLELVNITLLNHKHVSLFMNHVQLHSVCINFEMNLQEHLLTPSAILWYVFSKKLAQVFSKIGITLLELANLFNHTLQMPTSKLPNIPVQIETNNFVIKEIKQQQTLILTNLVEGSDFITDIIHEKGKTLCVPMDLCGNNPQPMFGYFFRKHFSEHLEELRPNWSENLVSIEGDFKIPDDKDKHPFNSFILRILDRRCDETLELKDFSFTISYSKKEYTVSASYAALTGPIRINYGLFFFLNNGIDFNDFDLEYLPDTINTPRLKLKNMKIEKDGNPLFEAEEDETVVIKDVDIFFQIDRIPFEKKSDKILPSSQDLIEALKNGIGMICFKRITDETEIMSLCETGINEKVIETLNERTIFF